MQTGDLSAIKQTGRTNSVTIAHPQTQLRHLVVISPAYGLRYTGACVRACVHGCLRAFVFVSMRACAPTGITIVFIHRGSSRCNIDLQVRVNSRHYRQTHTHTRAITHTRTHKHTRARAPSADKHTATDRNAFSV